jgi:hypothetical protein
LPLILALVAVYCLLGSALFMCQRLLIYRPTTEIESRPSEYGLAFAEKTLKSSDGVQFPVWEIGAGDGPLIIFFHGNAGNVSQRVDTYRIVDDLGARVWAPEYRGFGESSGQATEKGITLDLHTLAEHVREEIETRETQVIAMGRSLGGAVAARFAGMCHVAGLILESSFTSIADVGKRLLPIFPISIMVRDRFDTGIALMSVNCPVLVIHSHDDELIPFAMGRRLYRLAPEPKSFLEIEGPHAEGFIKSEETYRAGLTRFLRSLK